MGGDHAVFSWMMEKGVPFFGAGRLFRRLTAEGRRGLPKLFFGLNSFAAL